MDCRHCSSCVGVYARGLCRTCFRNKEVRLKYPMLIDTRPDLRTSQKEHIYAPECRCCGRKIPGTPRPRGLCWTCYYLPGVRDQFPSLSRFKQRGEPDEPTLLPEPTSHRPGTVEKIEVLEARCEAGMVLWHPEDAL